MKYAKTKRIIEEIARQTLVDSNNDSLFALYFPDPKTIDFLSKMVVFRRSFSMLCLYPKAITFDFPKLILHRKGQKWYLGYYLAHRTKHFSNFVNFFDLIQNCVPFYFFEAGNEILFSQNMPQTQILGFVQNYIAEINQDFEHEYQRHFIQIVSRFANTNIRLKIIVADCEGDFYVSYSKIWAFCVGEHFCLKMQNLRPNIRKPDYINKGSFVAIDRKIVQISYKNKVLFSTFSFSDSEMAWRKDYFLSLIEKYYAITG